MGPNSSKMSQYWVHATVFTFSEFLSRFAYLRIERNLNSSFFYFFMSFKFNFRSTSSVSIYLSFLSSPFLRENICHQWNRDFLLKRRSMHAKFLGIFSFWCFFPPNFYASSLLSGWEQVDDGYCSKNLQNFFRSCSKCQVHSDM